MWYYEIFRFFSRKELAKLQFGNKFFANAILKLKLPALHFIDRLHISTNNLPYKGIVCYIGKGEISADKCIPGETFCPPSYVRFSEVFLTSPLIIDAYFMERLKELKITFNNCEFHLNALNVREESANDTMTFMEEVFTGFRGCLRFFKPATILSPNEIMTTLMEDVFTECSFVALSTNKWTSVKQLKFCTLPGVYQCDKLVIVADQMVLSIVDPLFESMFEWLHSNRGSTFKSSTLIGIAGCEALFRKLTMKFVIDIECHSFVLCVHGPQQDFLDEFGGFLAENTTTGESMFSYVQFDDDWGVKFILQRFLPD